jgi:hypothetical protein
MTEATLAALNLDGKTPAELEQRRREIVSSLTTTYKGYDDPDVPTHLLHELAAITATLRRRTSGPPKVAKKTRVSKVSSTDDLMGGIDL